ncbi:MAG: glycosyltransferase, partial [Chloroflexi bacterium]|nr:glycosyltransferase [Chloroflexota bacterium]
MKITAVIPAHNEEDVIAHTITNLRAANPDSIIVIADGCTDSTAQ